MDMLMISLIYIDPFLFLLDFMNFTPRGRAFFIITFLSLKYLEPSYHTGGFPFLTPSFAFFPRVFVALYFPYLTLRNA
jgi:hypothetical protein